MGGGGCGNGWPASCTPAPSVALTALSALSRGKPMATSDSSSASMRPLAEEHAEFLELAYYFTLGALSRKDDPIEAGTAGDQRNPSTSMQRWTARMGPAPWLIP